MLTTEQRSEKAHPMSSPASLESRDDVSLVRDDPPFRWQRSIGLIPRSGGLGVGRRAVFWTALAWLPIALWAWWAGRALPEQGQTPEPLLQHFGVLARTARLRSATVPWVIIIGVALAWAFTGTVVHRAHELLWAAEGGSGPSLGFGGWWYVYVGRPIFIVLLLGWLWRLILLGVTLKRIAKLDLAIVPTHPDRAGGLGFVEKFPAAFSIVVFVAGMVRWSFAMPFSVTPSSTAWTCTRCIR